VAASITSTPATNSPTSPKLTDLADDVHTVLNTNKEDQG
jgi:hypothetical protein